MLRLDLLGAGARGDGARDTSDAGAPAAGEGKALDRAIEQRTRLVRASRQAVQVSASRDNPLAHRLRALARPGGELVCTGTGEREHQVEAVEERARNLVAECREPLW